MSKIFSHPAASVQTGGAQPTATTGGQSPGAQAPTSSSSTSPAAGIQAPAVATAPARQVDVAAVLNAMAAENPEDLDWKHSIFDLMKLVGMDSSLAARKELATDLHYTGDQNDSAAMNIWLHKQVLIKLSENGGKVPQELLKK